MPRIEGKNGVFFDPGEIQKLVVHCEMDENLGTKVAVDPRLKKIIQENGELFAQEVEEYRQAQEAYCQEGSTFPGDIPLQKWQLEPQIVVDMSAGAPEALIRVLEKKEDGSFGFEYHEPLWDGAKKAPLYLLRWARILNILFREQKDFFDGDLDFFEKDHFWIITRSLDEENESLELGGLGQKRTGKAFSEETQALFFRRAELIDETWKIPHGSIPEDTFLEIAELDEKLVAAGYSPSLPKILRERKDCFKAKYWPEEK